jgi:hypothetical protein
MVDSCWVHDYRTVVNCDRFRQLSDDATRRPAAAKTVTLLF